MNNSIFNLDYTDFLLIVLFLIFILCIYLVKKFGGREDINLIEIDNFLSDDEINKIISKGSPKLQKSGILSAREYSYTDESIRKSETAFMPDDEMTINIKKKASKYTKLPWFNAENLQLLKYNPGGKYEAHYDFFLSARNPNSIEYKKMISEGGDRIYTFFIYLNDDFTGGETEFPNLGKKIIPKKGKAVFWRNLHKDGSHNIFSKHSGNPVKSGIKYACNLWIREKKWSMLKDV